MALDDLKKLNPEERIKRLKKLEEERKKEIEEAKRMIKSSQEEIEVELIRKIKMPEQEAIEVEQMFRPRQADKQEDMLEKTVSAEKIPPPEQRSAEQGQYEIRKIEESFSRKSAKDLYSAVSGLMHKDAKDMNPYELHKVEAAYHRMRDIYDSAGGQKFRNEAAAVFGLHSRLMEDYRGNG